MKLTKKNLVIWCSLALLVALYQICFKGTLSEETPSPVSHTAAPMGIGSPADPQARLAFELQKLADPATGTIPPNMRERELAFAQTLPKKQSKTTDWYLRGPFNVGGRTRGFAMDINNENIILAGQTSGGLWRSDDGGLSYTKLTPPDQLHSVTAIAQDTRPGHTDTWYYGTGEFRGSSAGASFSDHFLRGNGIYKSTDGGLTWNLLTATASNTPTQTDAFDFTYRLVTDPSNMSEEEVYAAVYGGIFRSADGGATWDTVLGFDPVTSLVEYTDIAITSEGVVYAGLSHEGFEHGLFRSPDGINWTEITPNGWPADHHRIIIAIAPSDENQVFFLAETPNDGVTEHNLWRYKYLSGDGSGSGGAWNDRSNNLPVGDCSGFFTFEFASFNTQQSYDMAMVVHPQDTNVLFVGGTNVYRSTDAFQTDTNWAWIGGYQCDTDRSNYIYPNHHPDQHLFKFHPNTGDVLYTSSDGGLHKTLDPFADSVAWVSLNNGYYTSQFYTVDFEAGNATSDIIIGGMQDNGTFLSNHNSQFDEWKHVLRGDGSYSGIPEGRDFYILSWQIGKVFKVLIDDNGNTTDLTRLDPLGGSGYLFINPLILDKNNHNQLYIAGGRYIWRNHDLAGVPILNEIYDAITTNWDRISQSSIGLTPGLSITALDISLDVPNILYYGTNGGALYRLDSAHLSTATKTTVTGPDFPSTYMNCVAVDEHDYKKVMVCFTAYGVKSIFYTRDSGDTWEFVSGNLEENPDGTGDGPAVHWVNMLHQGSNTIYYAGTSVGLYSTDSLDGENTVWVQEGANTIGNVVVHMVKSRESDGLVALGTHGNGIYSNKAPLDVAVPEAREMQKILVRPYPNPFADQTQFDCYLSQPADVTLEIFDLEGKLVFATQSHLAKGPQTMWWQGQDASGTRLPNGLYLYQLSNGRDVNSGQLMLLR